MKKELSLVSIGVASYNNSKFITETLDSINSQTYKNIELIVLDDGSKDNSVEIINSWAKKCKFPFKFIINDKNEGITKGCNKIFENISLDSKYFAFFGSDDIMEPHRIETQVKLLEEDPGNLAGAFSDMTIINEKGQLINDSYFNLINETPTTINNFFNNDILYRVKYTIEKNIFPAPAVLYKTEVLKRIGKWDEELYFEDWDMNLRIIKEGFKFLFTGEKLIKYRKIQTSVTAKPKGNYYSSLLSLTYKYNNLASEVDNAINSKIKEYALLTYFGEGKNSFYWLRKKALLQPSFKILIYLLLSFLKVPYSLILKLKKALGK